MIFSIGVYISTLKEASVEMAKLEFIVALLRCDITSCLNKSVDS